MIFDFINETKRSELPDSAFGIPENRKYPLYNKQHVISAIKLFGHAEESKKKDLAKRIKIAADKYGIEIKPTTQVYKYLNESYINENKKYEDIYDAIINGLIKYDQDPKVSKKDEKLFKNTGKSSDDDFGNKLCICNLKGDYYKICQKLNKELKPLGARLSPDNYGTVFVHLNEQTQTERFYEVLKKKLEEDNNDEYINESTNKINLYFISENRNLKKLNPRIPSNFFTKNGYEDAKTKRICFSTDIGKCLTAVPMKYPGKEYYVYIPNPSKNYKIINPTIKQVPDVKITDEKWIIEPVDLICIGRIRCTGDAGRAGMKYKYGNNTAELYEWNFEWIEKYKEYYINEASSFVRVDIDRSELTEDMLIDAANKCVNYTKWCKMDNSSFCCVNELNNVSVNLNDATFCFARFNGDEESLNRVLKCCNENNHSRYGKFEVFAKENEHGIWLCGRMTELYTYKEVNEACITETSMRSKFNDSFEKKGNIKLSSFNKVTIDKRFIDKYKVKFKLLKHVDLNDDERIAFLDKDNNLVGYIITNKEKDGLIWITALEVSNQYKGYGLGKQLLDYGVKHLGAQALGVAHDNEVAIRMYEKYGFKISKESINEVKRKENLNYRMYIGSVVNESYINESYVDSEEELLLVARDVLKYFLPTNLDYVERCNIEVFNKRECKIANLNNIYTDNVNSLIDYINNRLHNSIMCDYYVEKRDDYLCLIRNVGDMVVQESLKNAVNDNGEKVPKLCPICGSKIAVYIQGEPVYLCTNKDCRQYFGVVPSHNKNKKSMNESMLFGNIKLDLNNISWWYVCDNKQPSDIDEELYYKTLEDAIKAYVKPEEFENKSKVEKYVYTNGTPNSEDGVPTLVCLGKIWVNDDYSYDWIVNYPIKIGDDGTLENVKEFSLASVNPIVGIKKPYVLKVHDNIGTSSSCKYALGTDLISDEYVIVNNESKLEVVNKSYLENCFVEEYEFVGNKKLLDKINNAYKEQKTVDNTFIYTALSGKPMLSSDQIEFDESFIKVDFDVFKEQQESIKETFKQQLMKELYENNNGIFKITEDMILSNPIKNEIARCNGEISLMQDESGYFYYNHLTNKYSKKVESMNMLTESMIKSIL